MVKDGRTFLAMSSILGSIIIALGIYLVHGAPEKDCPKFGTGLISSGIVMLIFPMIIGGMYNNNQICPGIGNKVLCNNGSTCCEKDSSCCGKDSLCCGKNFKCIPK